MLKANAFSDGTSLNFNKNINNASLVPNPLTEIGITEIRLPRE